MRVSPCKYFAADSESAQRRSIVPLICFYFSSRSHILQKNEFTSITYHPSLHKQEIIGISYVPSRETIITISKCKQISLLIQNINHKFEPYVFKLSCGVNCFDYQDGLIITGSNDKLLRVWNSLVTSKPKLVMSGHKSAIQSVKIIHKLSISYSKDLTLRVWDINYGTCLQSLQLLFPGVWNKNMTFEQMNLCIYPNTSMPNVFIVTAWEFFTFLTIKEKNGHWSSNNTRLMNSSDETTVKELKDENLAEAKEITDNDDVIFKYFEEKKKKLHRENSINVLKVKKYINNNRMKELAKDNTPFMALEVHNIN